MKYLFKKISLFLFILYPTILFSKQPDNEKKFILVNLIIKDSVMLNDASVQFEMLKDGVNTNFTLSNDVYVFKVNNIFMQIKVPLSTDINYGLIKYMYKGQLRYFQPFNKSAQSLYIFENRDSITLSLTEESIFFQGSKSEKYNCQEQIYNQEILSRSENFNRCFREQRYNEMFDAYKEQEDSLFNEKIKVLALYKSKISIEIYDLMFADCLAYYYSKLKGILSMKLGKQEFRESVERTSFKWFSKLNYFGLPDSTLTKSYGFCDFLLRKIQFDCALHNTSDSNTKDVSYNFQQIFNQILANYSGTISDKVMLLAFYFDLVGKDAKSYILPAYDTMGNNIFKTNMSLLLRNYEKSDNDFKLSDPLGRVKKLSDFRGKVIVVDYWFTGCVACAELAKELKPIIQSYKGNDKVVFISVSVDQDRKTWLKSVANETYSLMDEINLFTDGLGSRNPIIKHYNIQGYPSLMILAKDGSLITTSAPRPLKGSIERERAFKDLINIHL